METGGRLTTAAIVVAVVTILIVGTVLSLRASAKTGMPPEDVLERAKRRARELADRESESDEQKGD